MAFAQSARPIPGAVATLGVSDRVDFLRKTYGLLGVALIGFAAAQQGGGPEVVERLAARAQALAEKWDGARPISPDDFSEEDLVGTE